MVSVRIKSLIIRQLVWLLQINTKRQYYLIKKRLFCICFYSLLLEIQASDAAGLFQSIFLLCRDKSENAGSIRLPAFLI